MLLSLTLPLPALAGFDAVPKQPIDLSGHWVLNASLSDDAEAKLQKRIAEQAKERAKMLRRAREQGAFWLPDPPPEGEDEQPHEAKPPAQPNQGAPRPRRYDGMRQMLGISNTLDVTQSGARIDIVSVWDSRRFEAGVESQVSMPTGELADSRVGWDGQWFVIERRASHGPGVTEKYRWLKKTDQLESIIAWSGDSPLAGIKVHRIYDRGVADTKPPDAALGPVP